MGTPEVAGQTVAWDDLQAQAKEASAGVTLLTAGDVVNGFENLEAVDAFSDLCLHVASGYYYWRDFNPNDYTLDHKGNHTYRGWKDGLKHADDVMRPKNFWGQLINMEALVLDDINIPVTVGRPSPQIISYAFFADMYSSGSGVKGRVAKLVRVGSHVSASAYNTLLPTIAYTNLSTSTAEKAAEELQARSIAVSHEVVVSGLARMYSGGLPGHGKRR